MPTGIGGETIWVCPSIDGTGGSSSYNDISGNGIGYTNNGATIVSDSGNGGSYAMRFLGNNKERVVYSNPKDSTAGGWALSCWLKRDRTTGGFQLPASQFANNDRYFLLTQNANSGGYAFMTYPVPSTNANRVDTYAGSLPGTSTWVNLVMQYDDAANRQYMYENGVLTEDDSSNGFQTPTLGIELGASTQLNLGWAGRMDDFRMWERTLTQEEITHLAVSRGIEGPPGGAGFYNPFQSKTFHTLNSQRIR